mgnify:CR=1 FL=1
MNNLAIGLELLFTGLFVVFLVLLFLMYLMKAISWAVGEKKTAPDYGPSPVPAAEIGTEELIAVMAAVGKVLPNGHQAVVKVRPLHASGAEEAEMVVAAIAGALAAQQG